VKKLLFAFGFSALSGLGSAQFCDFNSAFTVKFVENNYVQFLPDTLDPYLDYYWDFGNGNVSYNIHPGNQYFFPGMHTVCLTVSNVSCSTTDCANMDLNTASISPVKTSALDLVEAGPNPFNRELNLTFATSGNYGLTLMDLSGRILFKRTLLADAGQTLAIRDKVESLPQGIYLLELNHKGEKEVRRLVKVK
jgi:hypothetical protein